MGYIEDGRLPLIYVRGFAGQNVDDAVEDPFYGFSRGSVHVRADGRGKPQFHQFESPLLRLVTDHGYTVPVHGDQRRYLNRAAPGKVDAASVWIHRFYDVAAASLLEDPDEFSLEKAADDLFELIRLVLAKTGAPKVFLVAHSMGGLICRSLLQRVIPEAEANGGALDPGAGRNYVARLFTYATPHGGIRFSVGGGILERLRDLTGILGADVFGPRRMYDYLTPAGLRAAYPREQFEGTRMPGDGFPVGEVFCLIGSNPEDYDDFFGLSSKSVGPKSDGLVQMDNAVVEGAHRAVVHRSHGGRFGVVNSEEGYQNLQRFLFGDLQVKLETVGFDVGSRYPRDLEFQMDVGLAIRGLPVLVHEQSAAHHCPVLVERLRDGDPIDSPKPLLTTFLSSAAPRPFADGAEVSRLRHALRLRLMAIREEGKTLSLEDHMEQTEEWVDTLMVDIQPPDETHPLPQAWGVWTSGLEKTLQEWNPSDSDSLEDLEKDRTDYWVGEIPVPVVARYLLGDSARIRITVTPRSVGC
jgi:hypothetical protein